MSPGSVAIGRHVLFVGDPAGTIIEPGAADGDPSGLVEALARPRVGSAAKEVVDAASEATARAEEAVDLCRAVAEGSILDVTALSGRIDVMLGLLERLDRDGRHEEALKLARAVNGLLALAMRWADLVRSLGIAAEAAEAIGDRAGAAWAQHELGTLHLAADDVAGAERRLSHAHRIRRELGDREGLAATEQNLDMPCRRMRELIRRDGPRRGRRRRRLVAAIAAFLLLLLGTGIGAVIAADDDAPPPVGAARLTVDVDGDGTVSSTPAGIDCPEDCERDFVRRSEIVLTPDPADGSRFTGWTGACMDRDPCILRLRRDRTVVATFREQGPEPPETVQLSVDPPVDGRITSTPPGIDCPGECTHPFALGDLVTLTAAAGKGFAFSAWGPDCSGPAACQLTMDAPHRASASFTPLRRITVTVEGQGTVTSEPPPLTCTQGPCSEDFPAAAGEVTLNAGGGTFRQWGGDCSGTDGPVCTLALDADHEASAVFETPPVVEAPPTG